LGPKKNGFNCQHILLFSGLNSETSLYKVFQHQSLASIYQL